MAGKQRPALASAIRDLAVLGLSKSEIARRLRVDRKTVRRYLDPDVRYRDREGRRERERRRTGVLPADLSEPAIDARPGYEQGRLL